MELYSYPSRVSQVIENHSLKHGIKPLLPLAAAGHPDPPDFSARRGGAPWPAGLHLPPPTSPCSLPSPPLPGPISFDLLPLLLCLEPTPSLVAAILPIRWPGGEPPPFLAATPLLQARLGLGPGPSQPLLPCPPPLLEPPCLQPLLEPPCLQPLACQEPPCFLLLLAAAVSFPCPPLALLQGPSPSPLPSHLPPAHLSFTPPLPSQLQPLLRALQRSGEVGGTLLPPWLQETLRRGGPLLLP
jgi:hypothetical protein